MIGYYLRSVLNRVARLLVRASLLQDMSTFGSSVLIVAFLLCFWGMLRAAAPVTWFSWVSSTMTDDADAGGGLVIATN
jgi:predicted MFS family arabinose efflux permease